MLRHFSVYGVHLCLCEMHSVSCIFCVVSCRSRILSIASCPCMLCVAFKKFNLVCFSLNFLSCMFQSKFLSCVLHSSFSLLCCIPFVASCVLHSDFLSCMLFPTFFILCVSFVSSFVYIASYVFHPACSILVFHPACSILCVSFRLFHPMHFILLVPSYAFHPACSSLCVSSCLSHPMCFILLVPSSMRCNF